MNRNKFGMWARRAIWCSLLAVATIGCSPLKIIGFLAPEEKAPALYPLTFKDGPKKDKDEIVVALLPHLAPDVGPSFYSTGRELASELERVLPEMAKENKDKKKLRIVPAAQVDKFKKEHHDWKTMTGGEIGEKLGADFVIDIELSGLRLYQPNTPDRVYDGRADVRVSVFEAGPNGGALKSDYRHAFSYQKGFVRSGDAVPESEFKKGFISRLALEIAEYHTDHKRGDGVGR